MTLKEGINDYHRTEADCSRGSQGHRDCNACCEVGASGGIAFDVLLDVFIYQFCMRFHDELCNRLHGRWYFPYFSSKKSCFSSVLPCLGLLFFSFRENVYTVVFPLFVSFFMYVFIRNFAIIFISLQTFTSFK